MKKFMLGLVALWLSLFALGSAVAVFKFNGGVVSAVFAVLLGAAAWRCWHLLRTVDFTARAEPGHERPWQR